MTSEAEEPGCARAAVPVGPEVARLELVVREVDRSGGRVEHDVEVTRMTASATVGDLVDAVTAPVAPTGERVDRAVVIDGAPVPRDRPLWSSGLRRGSVLTVRSTAVVSGVGGERPGETSGETGARPAQAGPTRMIVRTVAGPDAGREIGLAAGTSVVGGSRVVDVVLDDPALASRQAVLRVDPDGAVTVTDLCSPRPTRVGGHVVDGPTSVPPGRHLTMGSSTLELQAVEVVDGDVEAAARPPAGDRPPDAGRDGRGATGWTVALHRPPRGPAPQPVPTVRLPSAVSPPPAPPSPAGAAIVVTLAGGAVVSLLLHQPTFLVLSSIGALGTMATALWPWLRRRARRRAEGERARAAMVTVSRGARVPPSGCRGARLRAEALELPAAAACARRAGPELWARRSDDPGAFAAVVGRGDRWQPPALETGGDAVSDEWWALVEAAGALHDVPVAVSLGPGAVVGSSGHPRWPDRWPGAWSCSWPSPTARPTSSWPR